MTHLRTALRFALTALLLTLATYAVALPALLQGRLEIVWGDTPPGAPVHAAPQRVNLVTDDGRRIALDPARARRAAGDLYRLQGRQVTVLPDLAQEVASIGDAAATPLNAVSIVATDAAMDSLPTPNAVTGDQPWVSILCKFSDNTAEPNNLAYFANMLSNQPGRLDDYWRTVSYGKVNVAGSTGFGWFVLPYPRAHYIPSGGSADLNSLFTDCTTAANATVDFSPYLGINMMFNDNLDCCAWGGGHNAALDGVNKTWHVTWEPPWGYQNEAPLAHEMGHGFGLPHANNSDLDDDPYDNPWDVMSDAWDNAVNDATYKAQPKHINIYHRDRLGWVDAARKLILTANNTYPNLQLDRASLAGSTHLQMIKVVLPGAPATHYYVLETRMKIAGTYEAALAGNAVIIHEVDETREEPAWSVDAMVPPANKSNDEGSMFKVGESWASPGREFSVHVDSTATDAFILSITMPADFIFGNGFQ